ncbi:hypothetical protein L7F22_014453 [Adiantum nelumboides]|nr:hypothetical protein [Adiantum nelumboides]
MQNEKGENVDLYIPRKCSTLKRLITPKDHASVKLNIGHLDENGFYASQFIQFALSRFVRPQGDADIAFDRLWQKQRTKIGQKLYAERSCETPHLETCYELHFHILLLDFDGIPSINATLIHAYGSFASMFDAEVVLDKYSEPQVGSWTSCIAGYAGVGDPIETQNTREPPTDKLYS